MQQHLFAATLIAATLITPMSQAQPSYIYLSCATHTQFENGNQRDDQFVLRLGDGEWRSLDNNAWSDNNGAEAECTMDESSFTLASDYQGNASTQHHETRIDRYSGAYESSHEVRRLNGTLSDISSQTEGQCHAIPAPATAQRQF